MSRLARVSTRSALIAIKTPRRSVSLRITAETRRPPHRRGYRSGQSAKLKIPACQLSQEVKAGRWWRHHYVGRPTLVQSLTNASLVDEYRILIHPVIVNKGKRLFDQLRRLFQMKRMFEALRYRHTVTFAVASLIFAIGLSCFGLDEQGSKTAPADGKINTELTVQVTASRSLVKLRPNRGDMLPHNCEPTENKVRLRANAISPRKADLNFTWHVPVGRLTGKNREVTWDLRGVEAGTYTATVEATDKHKHSAKGSITITVIVCPGWLPDPPPCPHIFVSCPYSAESKAAITFEAKVSSGPAGMKPTYKWSLSAGKIIRGQGTPKITVDVSGLSIDAVTATVSVRGAHRNCPTDASCMVQLTPTKTQ